MTSWINSMGSMVLGWVLVGIGTLVLVTSIIWGGTAVAGKEKRWGELIANIAVGLLGGLLLTWSAASLISFYKSKGNEIPHS